MSYWLIDPQLFLYAKGIGPDDVLLWRCKKTMISSSSSSLVVPMKPDDFDFVKIVKNHLELIAYMIEWDEPDYNRLVKYIYEKRFLVNNQGLVIAELLQNADKYGKKTIDDDANEEDVPAIYIRSLDVLPLKPYIPKLTERPIPLRTVKYLGDVNGKAAMMEEDSSVTELTARVDNLEAENTRLESQVTKLTAKNNTLDTSVTQLTAGLATITGNVVDLQSKNQTLEAEINKTLDSNAKTLEGKVIKLTADLTTALNTLATLQRELKGVLENPNIKEVWMNDLTNTEWACIEKIDLDTSTYDKITTIGVKGTFTRDDTSSNVRARYCYTARVADFVTTFKIVCLEDLTPNKEKARFLPSLWSRMNIQGKTYMRQNLWAPVELAS